MAELRRVDPKTLKPNPNNPRRTPVPGAMDEHLLASIKTIGIIQHPVVHLVEDELVITAGARRVKAAIAAKMPVIDVIVGDTADTSIPMEALSENLVRAAMNNVDIWRAIQGLENAAGTSRPSPTLSRCHCGRSSGSSCWRACTVAQSGADEQRQFVQLAARNELGILEYCFANGMVDQTVVSKQRDTVEHLSEGLALSAVGAPEEEFGRGGILAFGQPQGRFEESALAQGLTLKTACESRAAVATSNARQ